MKTKNIKLSTESNWEKPFSKEQAEYSLFEMTATKRMENICWSPTRIIEKGQIIYPEFVFRSAWGWKKEDVLQFLSELHQKSKIDLSSDNNVLIITVITYNSDSQKSNS